MPHVSKGPFYEREKDLVLRLAYQSDNGHNSLQNTTDLHNELVLKLINQEPQYGPLMDRMKAAPNVDPPPQKMPENNKEAYVYVLSGESLAGGFVWDMHKEAIDPRSVANVFVEVHEIVSRQTTLYAYRPDGFQIGQIAGRMLTRLRDPWEKKFPPTTTNPSDDEVKAYKDWEGNILKQLQAMQNGVTTPMKFWRFDSKKDRFFPEVWINGKVEMDIRSEDDLSAGAEAKKVEGNKLFSAGMFQEAHQKYTEGLAIHPRSHLLYSNRSACALLLGNPEAALKDAQVCIDLKPTFCKGYYRKALGRFKEGVQELRNAIALEPKNESLYLDKQAMEALAEGDSQVGVLMRVCECSLSVAKQALENHKNDLILAAMDVNLAKSKDETRKEKAQAKENEQVSENI